MLQYINGDIDGDYLDHPGGGCRMGTDPAASVCDSFGRTHDHANLFVVGAPTVPAASVTNGTLAFVALIGRVGGAKTQFAHEPSGRYYLATREVDNCA